MPSDLFTEKSSRLQVGFSVPKKKFRKSVDRHRVRRLMVEAWRLNKQNLIDCLPEGQAIHVFLIFLNPELPDYDPVEAAVGVGMKKLCEIAQKSEM